MTGPMPARDSRCGLGYGITYADAIEDVREAGWLVIDPDDEATRRRAVHAVERLELQHPDPSVSEYVSTVLAALRATP